MQHVNRNSPCQSPNSCIINTQAEAETNDCQHELNTFKQQIASGSIGDGAIASLQQMLKNTAAVYRTLRDYANNLQAPIPPDAIVGPYHPDADLDYDALQLAAADNYWDDFKDEGVWRESTGM